MAGEKSMFDFLDDMMAWESGTLNHDDEVALFQKLVDTGMAWQLQGAYGRHAMRLIEAGDVDAKHQEEED